METMKCHYCKKETEYIVKFADNISRPYCGCANVVWAEMPNPPKDVYGYLAAELAKRQQ